MEAMVVLVVPLVRVVEMEQVEPEGPVLQPVQFLLAVLLGITL